MIFGADAPATAAPAAATTWDKIKAYASDVEDLYDAPVVDAAAVIGVEATWLTGFLLALKLVATGAAMAYQDAHRHQ
ncbi:MAG: hypothetical protein JO277_08920 [Candidatus Eremiobacteraeota bacterium]|nr:hypothetical protein [Candidatus Eremiobacteraeota bacterium]